MEPFSPLAQVCLTAALGLLVGSFLNVVIYRLPKMLQTAWQTTSDTLPTTWNLAWPASHCPHCQHAIAWFDNVPLWSFIQLKGRCRHCHTPIAWHYPLVELSSAILSALVAIKFGWSLQTGAALIFVWIGLALTVIDWQHQLLPDALTLPLLWLGLLLNTNPRFTSPSAAILGAALGYGIFWLVNQLSCWLLRKDGLGGGDAKLLAALGAWFGWEMIPHLILISALLASVIGGFWVWRKGLQHTHIPFGPFLVIAGMLTLFTNQNFIEQWLWHW